MASKKAGRLAGLAALAGLAYMNKDKLFGAKDKTSDTVKSENKSESKSKSVDRDTDTGMEVMPSYAAKNSFKDAMFEKEPGPYLTDDKAMFEKEPESANTTPLTFGKAFREARNAGGKTFMFNNKKYTTELAKPAAPAAPTAEPVETNKRGGVIKKMASGGMTASASKRGDGIAQRGKTRGKMC